MAVDEQKLEEFVGRFAGDLGAVAHAATVLVGDQLGLYRAMGDSTWMTPAELAERTGTDQRYIAEWLAAQAASGYAEHDTDTGRFRLSEEQAFALSNEWNPLFIPGGLQVTAAAIKDVDLLARDFRAGEGLGWHEHHDDLFEGTLRFFRPNYIGNLFQSWIPALDGIEERLRQGGRVADVGCGQGASTIIMAREYPASTMVGYDSHDESIIAARKAAAEAGMDDRCRFEVASAKDFPGTGFDLVTSFDCLHDMGDPTGAAAHACESLAEDGSWMVVEPLAADAMADNLNPLGRIFYSLSCLICVPVSRSQEVGATLGAQAGESRLRQVITDGGFDRVDRVAETPFNMVLEARR